MVEPRLPNFRISRDAVFNNIKVTQSLTVDGTRISCPPTNFLSGRIFNDATYNNVTVTNGLDICNTNITSSATDPQWDAYRQAAMRIESAQFEQGQSTNTVWSRNMDEMSIPSFIAMFSKTLNHNSAGRVVSSDYQTLRDGIEDRDIAKITSVPNPGTLKLVQPLGAFILNPIGPAPSTV